MLKTPLSLEYPIRHIDVALHQQPSTVGDEVTVQARKERQLRTGSESAEKPAV